MNLREGEGAVQSRDSSSSLNLGDRSGVVRLTWFGTASWFFLLGTASWGVSNAHCRKRILGRVWWLACQLQPESCLSDSWLRPSLRLFCSSCEVLGSKGRRPICLLVKVLISSFPWQEGYFLNDSQRNTAFFLFIVVVARGRWTLMSTRCENRFWQLTAVRPAKIWFNLC